MIVLLELVWEVRREGGWRVGIPEVWRTENYSCMVNSSCINFCVLMGVYEVWIRCSGFDLDNEMTNGYIIYWSPWFIRRRMSLRTEIVSGENNSDGQEMKTDGFSHMHRATKTDGKYHRYLIWIRVGIFSGCGIEYFFIHSVGND